MTLVSNDNDCYVAAQIKTQEVKGFVYFNIEIIRTTY